MSLSEGCTSADPDELRDIMQIRQLSQGAPSLETRRQDVGVYVENLVVRFSSSVAGHRVDRARVCSAVQSETRSYQTYEAIKANPKWLSKKILE